MSSTHPTDSPAARARRADPAVARADAMARTAAPACPAPARVVTWDAPRLVAALRLGLVRPLGTSLTVCATLPGVVEAAAAQHADVVLLPASVVPPSPLSTLAHEIRARVPRAKVLLAVPHELRHSPADLLTYDGLVSLDEPELDLTAVLPPLLAPPAAGRGRPAVLIPTVLMRVAGPTVAAVATEVSDRGAELAVPGGTSARGVVAAAFDRTDGRNVTIACLPDGRAGAALEGACRVCVRVRFSCATLGALRSLRDLAFWRVVTGPDGDTIHLSGPLVEATPYTTLARQVERTPRLDLAAVPAVTPGGLRRWYEFLCGLPPGLQLRLGRLSPTIGPGFAALPRMTCRCVVESLHLDATCGRCGAETVLLATTPAVPAATCSHCGGPVRVGRRERDALQLLSQAGAGGSGAPAPGRTPAQ
jgi:hypothetical protein